MLAKYAERLTYRISNRLYVPLTLRSPTISLGYARLGNNAQLQDIFTEPSTIKEFNESMKALKEHEPEVDDIVAAVDYIYETDPTKASAGMGENDGGIVFSNGVGEPLLRIGTLLESVIGIKERRHGIKMRVGTSGLLGPQEFGYDDVADGCKDDPSQLAQKMKDTKIKEVSVFLPAADPTTYLDIMHPKGVPAGLKKYHNLGAACNFITSCAEVGLQVRVIALEKRPLPRSTSGKEFVDVRAVRDLAMALGAVDCVTKPYITR